MKTRLKTINTNANSLTLKEVLQSVITQEVQEAINKKTIEVGGKPISDLSEIQKKTDSGVVVRVADDGFGFAVRLDSTSEIIEPRIILGIFPTLGAPVDIEYDSNNQPFIARVNDPFSIKGRMLGAGLLIPEDDIDDTRIFSTQLHLNIEDQAPELTLGVSRFFPDAPNATGNRETNIEIELNKIKLNNDHYGGLIKIDDLTAKLNDLVDEIRILKTYISTHVHASAAPGSPTTAPIVQPTNVTFSSFNSNDYENETVTHGF